MPDALRRIPTPALIAAGVLILLILVWAGRSSVWLMLGLIIVVALLVGGYVYWQRYTERLDVGPDEKEREIQEQQKKEREEAEEQQRQREEAMDSRRGGEAEDQGGEGEQEEGASGTGEEAGDSEGSEGGASGTAEEAASAQSDDQEQRDSSSG